MMKTTFSKLLWSLLAVRQQRIGALTECLVFTIFKKNEYINTQKTVYLHNQIN